MEPKQLNFYYRSAREGVDKLQQQGEVHLVDTSGKACCGVRCRPFKGKSGCFSRWESAVFQVPTCQKCIRYACKKVSK